MRASFFNFMCKKSEYKSNSIYHSAPCKSSIPSSIEGIGKCVHSLLLFKRRKSITRRSLPFFFFTNITGLAYGESVSVTNPFSFYFLTISRIFCLCSGLALYGLHCTGLLPGFSIIFNFTMSVPPISESSNAIQLLHEFVVR